MEHIWRGVAMLHAQAGLSSDAGTTPGVRIPYGSEPDPVSHVQALLPHHQHYLSGVSEILTLDEKEICAKARESARATWKRF